VRGTRHLDADDVVGEGLTRCITTDGSDCGKALRGSFFLEMQKYSCCSHAKYICLCIYGAEMLPEQPLGIGHSHHSAELPGPLDGIHHVKATNRDKGSLLEEVGELHST